MARGDGLGSYENRIRLARAAGMTFESSVTTMTLAGLIMGFWIFYGYYIPTFFSEEIANPTRSLFVATVGALSFSFLLFSAAALLLQRLVPLEWIAAEGFLFNNPDAASDAAGGRQVPAMPWITFYAAILRPNSILIFLVAFAWIYTLVNLVQTYFFYSSRIVYSWSLDRVVPDWVLGRDPLNPNPNRSLAIIAVLAIVGVVDSAYGGPLGTQLTFVFFAVVTGLVPVFALTFLPKLRPEVFAQVPPPLRKTYLGIPLSSLIGAVTLAYLLWMIFAAFRFPAVGVVNPWKTLALLGAIATTGLLLFIGMRRVRQAKEGIEIMATYRQLPTGLENENVAFDEITPAGRV
jgi:amino acid transporter